ncbi:hypothetical protein [Sphingobium nicotianae]|uniref:Uncharacterized protein n=1 Tax=Sphingobium nicotianae TaxID=2782607 RepID=A0A9X1D9L2_9SPHN|nr:hypothetical protein [Sphingobium nicotianae]MBT2185540.1 hypothetical protein [Sphingobium nicotianae]
MTQDFLIAANTARAKTPYLKDAQPHFRDEANGVLVGEVIVLPRDSDKETKRTLKELLNTVHQAMDEQQQAHPAQASGAMERLPSEILNEIEAKRDLIACYRIKFAIFRTGEVRLWYDWNDFLGRDSIAEPADRYEQIVGDVLPAQAYYFLKDVFHFHYHHDPRTDQLLDLTSLGNQASALNTDVEWRIDTLRGLAKVVVEYRQSPRPDSNKKALGVLAYADAFQSLLARVKRATDLNAGFLPIDDVILYDFDHSRDSIEALDALSETRRSGHLQLFGILIGVILSALALWAGAVQIQPILCGDSRANAAICPPTRPGITTDLINWVVANPLGFVVVLTMAGFLAYIFLFRGVTNVPLAKPILRFVRLMSAALGAEVAKRSRADRVGYYAQLAFLGALVGFIGWAAYQLTPKNVVPPVAERKSDAAQGPWASLEGAVGRLPRDSGLFTSSVVAPQIRDMLGGDYEEFLRSMAVQSVLRRRGPTLWALGTRARDSQDGAYLLMDQRTRQIEVGVRKDGKLSIYRSTGRILFKPGDVQKFVGGAAADIGPFPIETSVCRSNVGRGANSTMQLSGALRGIEGCEYRLQLRQGQIVSFSPASARGLDVSLVTAGETEPLSGQRLIQKDGTYSLKVSWQRSGGPGDELRPLRPFYARIGIR